MTGKVPILWADWGSPDRIAPMAHLTPVPRVALSPEGGTPKGWLPAAAWQWNQRLAVRGRRAWYRPSRSGGLVEFHRIDCEAGILADGLDGWGPVVCYGGSGQSVWRDPAGRHHFTLRDAIAAW